MALSGDGRGDDEVFLPAFCERMRLRAEIRIGRPTRGDRLAQAIDIRPADRPAKRP